MFFSGKPKKIGRNSPCYCGSGIKYKKCHLNRENQPEVTEGQVREFGSTTRVPKKCFYASVDKENCKGKIIEAHTVSKSGSLRKISRNGKVYSFKPNINVLFNNNGRLKCQEIGIGQASTFPGFCAYHDKKLFSPIEDSDFEPSIYHATLLGYRAISREIYAKQHQANGVPFLRTMDKGKSEIIQQALQGSLHAYQTGIDAGLADLLSFKEKHDNALKTNDFNQSRFLIIEFKENPNILFSGAIYPEFDFQGNRLQTINGSPGKLDLISINAISTTKGGAVAFQWFDDSSINVQFIQSLINLSENRWADAITQFAFEFIENLFISPDWWDGISTVCKKSLEDRVMHFNHAPNCLVPPTTQTYFSWKSPEISSNTTIKLQ